MRRKSILLATALTALLMIPATAWSDTGKTGSDQAVINDVAAQLSQFEEQAAKVTHDAEVLVSLSRNFRTNPESHAYYLNGLKDDINQMGALLAELEQMKPQATEAQRLAIENVRPHMVLLAAEATNALALAREGHIILRQTPYREAVANMSKHAEVVYQTLDTIVDYHEAHERLENLEPSHGDATT